MGCGGGCGGGTALLPSSLPVECLRRRRRRPTHQGIGPLHFNRMRGGRQRVFSAGCLGRNLRDRVELEMLLLPCSIRPRNVKFNCPLIKPEETTRIADTSELFALKFARDCHVKLSMIRVHTRMFVDKTYRRQICTNDASKTRKK